MTPQRWELVEGLFQATAELPAEQRSAFLRDACGGDADLQSEVESLLAASGRESQHPALQSVLHGMAAACFPDSLESLQDRRFGAYQVLRRIGEGGMGEVFLALDTRLGRRVAVKLLHAEYTRDRDRLRRFQQEARAASSLSHPNILVVYELGETADRTFLVTEFVEGETLRQLMRRERMTVAGILDAGMQTAAALAAAHDAGIVHRDVKPENIMVRPDGYVKVLDFGLAKLAGDSAAAGPDHATLTTPGMVMGTVAYMAPEQARGQPVDARSDIFSLGVVLYEMAAGKPPFRGETRTDTLIQTVRDAPPKMDGVPPRLEQLILKALEKRPEDRFQSMAELQEWLKRLKQDIDLESALVRAGSTPVMIAPRSSRRALLLWGLAGAGAVAAGGGIWRTRSRPPFSRDAIRLTHVALPADAGGAVLSPDGKSFLYTRPSSAHCLWIKQPAAGSTDLRIAIPENHDHVWGMTYSPDGTYVYYVNREGSGQISNVYRIPALGGTPRRVAESANQVPAVSADGRRLLFRRFRAIASKTGLVMANSDGSGERIVAESDEADAFSPAYWTPDGKAIQYVVRRNTPAGIETALFENRPEGGAEKMLLNWSPQSIVWALMTDPRGVFVISPHPQSRLNQIWYISLPDGKRYPVTNDANDYIYISCSAAGDVILAGQRIIDDDVWVADFGEEPKPRRVTNGGGLYSAPLWIPGGRIAYVKAIGGVTDLWVGEADGGQQYQLTSSGDVHGYQPALSRDGKMLAFTAGRSGNTALYRVNLDGGRPVPIATGALIHMPCFSADGKWLFYLSGIFDGWDLWKVPSGGGQPSRVIGPCLLARLSLSPDGRTLACQTRGTGSSPLLAALLPVDGAGKAQTVALPQNTSELAWLDPRSLLYSIEGGPKAGIWSLPLDGGDPIQLLHIDQPSVWSFDVTGDGKRAVYVAGRVTVDAILITGFR